MSQNQNQYKEKIYRDMIYKTPIFSWFTRQKFVNPGYYNQAILLELKNDIPHESWNTIMQVLIKKYDSLRLNYNSSINVIFINEEHLTKSQIVQSGYIPNVRTDMLLKVIPNLVTQNFNLQKDLLIKPYVLKTRYKSYLYIIAHHLVIDVVSLKILLEDIITLLSQINNNQILVLPKTATSYFEYAEKYTEWAKKQKIEGNHWYNYINKMSFPYAKVNLRHFTNGSVETISSQLDINATKKLCNEAKNAYSAEVNELLLIAFAKAVFKVFSIEAAVIEIDDIGRNNLKSFTEDRMVGWFACKYPLVVKKHISGLRNQIETMRDQIRGFSKMSYVYEIDKYFLGKELPDHYVFRFNYLGEFNISDNDYLEMKHFYFSGISSNKNSITAIIDINIIILNNMLQLSTNFSKNLINIAWIKQLDYVYKEQIMEIIDYCKQ